jgi:hypothetical protein
LFGCAECRAGAVEQKACKIPRAAGRVNLTPRRGEVSPRSSSSPLPAFRLGRVSDGKNSRCSRRCVWLKLGLSWAEVAGRFGRPWQLERRWHLPSPTTRSLPLKASAVFLLHSMPAWRCLRRCWGLRWGRWRLRKAGQTSERHGTTTHAPVQFSLFCFGVRRFGHQPSRPKLGQSGTFQKSCLTTSPSSRPN